MKALQAVAFSFLTLACTQNQAATDPDVMLLKDYLNMDPDSSYARFLQDFKPTTLDKLKPGGNEYEKRKYLFLDRLDQAVKYNEESLLEGREPTAGINSLFDLTKAEFKQRHGYGREGLGQGARHRGGVEFARRGQALPASIDWSAKGAVTPVKDQGQCGSCWVFGTIGAIESYLYLLHNATQPLQSLSEQYVGSCNGLMSMCEGGWPIDVYAFTEHNNNTLCTEKNWPYISGDGLDYPCTKKQMDNFVSVFVPSSTLRYISPGDDQALMEALVDGPVTVVINASLDSMQMYRSGVYDDPKCTNRLYDLDHAVLAVGYGVTDDGTPYWKVKNSWGAGWGEDGYIRMRRGSGSADDPYNDFCGISLNAVQPVKEK